MTAYRYSTKIGEGMARAVARSLPISTKQSIEICNFIKNRSLDEARELLKKVAEKKATLPFRRFTGGVGHKRGMASGSYPQKACKEFIKVLDMVEANAQHKGLGSNLKIKNILAQRASTPWHFGRKRRRKMKRTHVEVVVEELKKDGRKEKEAKEIKGGVIKKEGMKKIKKMREERVTDSTKKEEWLRRLKKEPAKEEND